MDPACVEVVSDVVPVVVVPTKPISIALINERSRLSVALRRMVPIATPTRSTLRSPSTCNIPKFKDAQSVLVLNSGEDGTETEFKTMVGEGESRLMVPSNCTIPASTPPRSALKSPCTCKSPRCKAQSVTRRWVPT
jgi:hypothetical protein